MKSHEHFIKKWGVLGIIGMVLGGVLIASGMALILGFIVMLLWNWLMPNIFGLTAITFWQAWGLVLLAHIFFKSFPHHKETRHDEYWKKRFKDKFFADRQTEEKEPAAE